MVLTILVLQTLHQPRCPSLDTLKHLNVLLVARGPKLNTVLQVRPHQCQVQGQTLLSFKYAGSTFTRIFCGLKLMNLYTFQTPLQVALFFFNKHPTWLAKSFNFIGCYSDPWVRWGTASRPDRKPVRLPPRRTCFHLQQLEVLVVICPQHRLLDASDGSWINDSMPC